MPCASRGPVRQAGPSVAYPRRTSGTAIPGHGKGRLRQYSRRSRPGRVALGMEARQGRDAKRLDAEHDSPAPRSGEAPAGGWCNECRRMAKKSRQGGRGDRRQSGRHGSDAMQRQSTAIDPSGNLRRRVGRPEAGAQHADGCTEFDLCSWKEGRRIDASSNEAPGSAGNLLHHSHPRTAAGRGEGMDRARRVR